MASAKQEVREVYPEAECVRSTFGMKIVDRISGNGLSDGRAYYEEEAWIDAVGNLSVNAN